MNFTATLICFLLGYSSVSCAGAIDLGTEKQLFVDDVRIEKKVGVSRVTHPAQKLAAPVVEPEKAWEGNRVYTFGSVYFDPDTKEFRMWYSSFPSEGGHDPALTHNSRALVNYATSSDGIRWEKPNLGVYSYEGSRDNNIVYDLDSPSVIVDIADPDPEKRYKMMGVIDGSLMALVAYSSDGIHWNDYPNNPVFKTEDTLSWIRDPISGEYMAYHKLSPEIRGFPRRSVYLSTSQDMKNWSPSKLIMAPDEADDAWVSDPRQRTEFYNMSAFPYGDQFLGMITIFRVERENENPKYNQSRLDGPIFVELVHSRDGREWKRLEERAPIVENGPGTYDAGCILGLINTPVINEDEVWMYYTAITTGHGGAIPEKRITIARASWRLDGFVSLDAGEEGGTVETVALELPGNQLEVNADASKGSLAVEVLDEEGKTLPGYSADDCINLKADEIRHVVKWKNQNDLPTGQAVHLRFCLKNASLYSYCVKSVD